MAPGRKRTLFALVFLLLVSTRAAQALTVTLAWDAPADPTVVGYVVSYGTSPGSYSSTVDVGNVTSSPIGGLASATTYYFMVESYNTDGVRSTPSGEAVYTPLSISCRVTAATSPDGNPVSVTLNPPVVSGATGTVTTVCVPASGSRFPVGDTAVNCTATDSTGSVSCQGIVTVTYTSPPPPDTGGGSSPPPAGPIYEIPPPPGSYGFSDHGYYAPSGGWVETRRLSAGSSSPGFCMSPGGAPGYEIPPPPGAYGFSNHGYYSPRGGWVETRQTGGGGAPVAVPCGYAAPVPSAPSGGSGSYQIPPPAGSWGFTDHGYYRPDGGWEETPRTNSFGRRVAAPAGAALNNPAAPATSPGTSPGRATIMTGARTAKETVKSGSGTSGSAASAASGRIVRAPASSQPSQPPQPPQPPRPAQLAQPAQPAQPAQGRAATSAVGGIVTDTTPPAMAFNAGPIMALKAASAGSSSVGSANAASSNADSWSPAAPAGESRPRLRAPSAPTGASPRDAGIGVALTATLGWTAAASTATPVTYDVYLGDNPDPPLAAAGLSDPAARVQRLAPATTYYWRVVARNAAGETTSRTWTFTTTGSATK